MLNTEEYLKVVLKKSKIFKNYLSIGQCPMQYFFWEAKKHALKIHLKHKRIWNILPPINWQNTIYRARPTSTGEEEEEAPTPGADNIESEKRSSTVWLGMVSPSPGRQFPPIGGRLHDARKDRSTMNLKFTHICFGILRDPGM